MALLSVVDSSALKEVLQYETKNKEQWSFSAKEF